MDAAQIRFDGLLTKVSIAYKNGNFVASRVFPEVPVDAQSGKYLKAGKHHLRPAQDLRAPGAVANEIEWQLSSDLYFCDGHAEKTVIPDEWRGNGLDLDTTGTENLTQHQDLNADVNLFNIVTAGLVAVDVTAAGKAFDNDANDPIAYLQDARNTKAKTMGVAPNVLLLSKPVFTAIKRNANVASRITGAADLASANVTAVQLAGLLELDEVIVAETTQLTSNEGAADAGDFIWGKYGLLFYRPRTPAQGVLSLGYTLTWRVGMKGRAVRKYRIEERTADAIESQRYYDHKIVAEDAGVLLSNCIA
jgi:hypothetical protein